MESNDARVALAAVAEAEHHMKHRPHWPDVLLALSFGTSLFTTTLNHVLGTVISLVVLVVAVGVWFLMRRNFVRESTRQPIGTQESWSWKRHWPILLLMVMIPFPSLLKIIVEPSWPAAAVVGLLGTAAAWVVVRMDRQR